MPTRRAAGVKPPYHAAVLNRQHPLAQGLIGFWLLNEGGLAAVNLVDGRRATLTSGLTRGPQGMVFPGTDQAISIPGVGPLMTVENSGFTYEVVGSISTLSGWKSAYVHRLPNSSTGDAMIAVNGQTVFWDGTNENYFGPSIAVGQTYQWAVTVAHGSGSRGWIGYVDGANGGSGSTDVSAHFGPPEIGRWAGSLDPFAGTLRHVRVWSRPLTGAEVRQLHTDPYAMLVPLPRPRFFVAAGGGGTFTGAIAATLPALTASAAGTFEQDFNGTSAITLPALTAAATATFVEPVYTGALAPSLPALTAAMSGTFVAPVYTGSIAATLPALAAAATGAFDEGIFQATVAATLPALTSAASGSFVTPAYTGNAAATLPALTAAATGTHTIPVVTGTAAISLPALMAAMVGDFASAVYTGTIAATLPALTAQMAGTFAAAVAQLGVRSKMLIIGAARMAGNRIRSSK